MKSFCVSNIKKKTISIMERVKIETEDGFIIGDVFRDLTPTMTYGGWTFDELKKGGLGEYKHKEPKDD